MCKNARSVKSMSVIEERERQLARRLARHREDRGLSTAELRETARTPRAEAFAVRMLSSYPTPTNIM